MAILRVPRNLGYTPLNYGFQMVTGQVGGPQGNPNGTIQARPYPDTDPVGVPVSFGVFGMIPPYGIAGWSAQLPVNNQQAMATTVPQINGLIKQPINTITF